MSYPRLTTALREEFADHLTDAVNDGRLTEDNRDEWHHVLFNEDYYIIGYYEAEQWLKRHGFGELASAAFCQEYERDNFGESFKTYDNAEKVVNMMTYILGEEWMYEDGNDLADELMEEDDEDDE